MRQQQRPVLSLREAAQPGGGQPLRHQFVVMVIEKGTDGDVSLLGIAVDLNMGQVALQPRGDQIGIDRQSLKCGGIRLIGLSLIGTLPGRAEIGQSGRKRSNIRRGGAGQQ